MMPQTRSALRILLALAFILPLLSGASRRSGDAESEPAARGEEEVLLSWSFEHGLPPDGWGWGNWILTEGALEGDHREGVIAAYFFPFECPEDFILETRVMVLERHFPDANVQILIRNNDSVTFESGIRLYAERDTLVVRHRAWSRDLVLDWYRSPVPLEVGEWHVLRFGIIAGHLLAEVDGQPLPLPDLRVPVGEYSEPHLSIDRVRARFDEFRILRYNGDG